MSTIKTLAREGRLARGQGKARDYLYLDTCSWEDAARARVGLEELGLRVWGPININMEPGPGYYIQAYSPDPLPWE